MLSNIIHVFTIQFVQVGFYKIKYLHFTSFAPTTHKEPPGPFRMSLGYVRESPKGFLIGAY